MAPKLLPELRDDPVVSVLIGNYNYAQYIGQAIESVLAQSYQNFEICICDDGSTDQSAEIASQYAARDSRIKLRVQENQGQGSALNAAWGMATGDVITLVDSDDIWLPSKLSRIVRRFRSVPQAGMVTHAVRYVRADLSVIRPQPDRGQDEGWLAPALVRGMRPRMPPCSALALRREIADLVFPLEVRYRGSADVLMRELAALITNVAAIDEELSLYRIHGNNLVGLRSSPTDLRAIRRTLSSIEEAWLDRQGFVLRHQKVELSGELWNLRLGAELRLAERLLTGQNIDHQLLKHLPAGWLSWFWRSVFACPRPLGCGMFRMRSAPSVWKTCLKAALHFRREALTTH